MANSLATSLAWCQPFVKSTSLAAWTNSEPAVSSANLIAQMMLNAPFTWSWNRVETTITLTTGTQDYSETYTNFGFLEKVSLTDAAGSIWEVKDVYNTQALGVATTQQRPNACAVITNTPGTGQKFRFMGVPDYGYTATMTYQKLAALFTTTAGGWSPIPDQYSDVYNPLLLAYMMEAFGNSQGAAYYRSRGIAALLSKAQGLSQTQINVFLGQFYARDSQQAAMALANQQGIQARAQ